MRISSAPGTGRAAAFETRIWWSPGSAARAILQRLAELGHPGLGDVERFVVKGKYGPLADGDRPGAPPVNVRLRPSPPNRDLHG